MALTREERSSLIATLDKCDAALADKPTLSKIFGGKWRTRFREQILGVDSFVDAVFPEAYFASNYIDFPDDYQQRIEDGATIMLTGLKGRARSDFFSRIKCRDPASATEELLLARGFFRKFGEIDLQLGNPAAPRAEFNVDIQGQTIAVEARGLRNSRIVQELNDRSWRSGKHYWISTDPEIGKPKRVRKALVEKILESAKDLPRIIILSSYSPFDDLDGINIARQMAIKPESFDLPQINFPLAIVYASHRLLQGLWFNSSVVNRLQFSRNTQDAIIAAIRESIYSRTDGVFLHDGLSEEEHNSLLWNHYQQ